MKRTLLLILAVLGAWTSLAQERPHAELPGKPPITPVVHFIFDWRAQNPPRYDVAIDSIGSATYQSEPQADPNGGSAPEPYFIKWTASHDTCDKIFDAARKLNYFNGKFESNAKVALTGLKTLTYKDLTHDSSTSYNYSENPLIRELTHIFQSIATTTEMGRKLAHDIRYDKLGIDADLKVLQQQQRQGDAIEIAAIAPVLQQIAGNPAMFRMSQQRARELLRSAGIRETSSESSTQGQE